MRVYLKLSPSTEIVPFNYQSSLVGAFHKWLGENDLHDETSLYSLSWLSRGVRVKNGLRFPDGAEMFISSPNLDLFQVMMNGVMSDPSINWGMSVEEATMKITPDFGEKHRFSVQSPVLVKRKRPDGKHYQYFYPKDESANQYLTETLQHKLSKAGMATDVKVSFDKEYRRSYTKLIKYRDLEVRGSVCPVIIEGPAEAVKFAWEVGVGNSTGIGFGALI